MIYFDNNGNFSAEGWNSNAINSSFLNAQSGYYGKDNCVFCKYNAEGDSDEEILKKIKEKLSSERLRKTRIESEHRKNSNPDNYIAAIIREIILTIYRNNINNLATIVSDNPEALKGALNFFYNLGGNDDYLKSTIEYGKNVHSEGKELDLDKLVKAVKSKFKNKAEGEIYGGGGEFFSKAGQFISNNPEIVKGLAVVAGGIITGLVGSKKKKGGSKESDKSQSQTSTPKEQPTPQKQYDEEKPKKVNTTKILLYTGVSILGIGLIGTIIYLATRKKTQ